MSEILLDCYNKSQFREVCYKGYTIQNHLYTIAPLVIRFSHESQNPQTTRANQVL